MNHEPCRERVAVLSATLTLLLALPAGPAPAAPAGASDERRYARPHALVDVGDGRHMNLHCRGSGSPTVVFDSGSGLAGWDWVKVHPAIAASTRACVYDRAGLGFSDAPSRAGTSAHAVADLHALLVGAGIAPPYVLVGHSYGGMNVQLYAYTYPAEVVGLVNVDGGHEDEAARIDRLTQGKFAALMREYEAMAERCAQAASKGALLPGAPAFAACIGRPPAMFGAPLAAAWMARQMRPAYWAAARSEEANDALSADQLRAARRPFGALPLVYLTRGVSPFLVPGKPQGELNKATERDVAASHLEIARLSNRGTHRIVAGAGHSIHVDKPQAVIAAIREVLAQVGAAPGR